MIETMNGLPDEVLGIRATGRITAADYETVVVPAVENRLRRHDRIRLLYYIGPEFEGIDAHAVWDDAKVGLMHLGAWERMAVVTDVEWIRAASRFFGFMMPAEVRVFDNARLDEARDWIRS